MSRAAPRPSPSEQRRAGEDAPGYALHVFPRAINPAARRSTNQAKTYTYPQPTFSKSASTPGSKFGRYGGSNLDRRRQLYGVCRRGQGSIYRMSEAGEVETLYEFTGGDDGGYPVQGYLLEVADGEFYGANGKGVYRLKVTG